ncbi:MAG: ABC transporter permease, partial [Dehalococcoidia bacterium]|nr:ABC transporter permease [Dehalococcoidia bacterium]
MATLDTYLGDYLPTQAHSAPVRTLNGAGRFVRTKPLGAFGALMLVLIVVVGVFSPWIAPDSLGEAHFSDSLEGPFAERSAPDSGRYWFGTDQNGRDIYSRIVYGCQVTALVGVGTVLLVSLLSLLVGVSSGYFGGRFDFLVQRVVDVWLSFPAIFLILTLVAVLNPGTNTGGGFFGLGRGPDVGPDPNGGPWIWNTLPRTTIVILALGLVLAGGASRVVRSAVFATRANPYIEAATVLGASNFRIILRHVLPNILPTVIVLATVQLGVAILAEATISFLGVGITNFPTWGQMLSARRDLFE